MRRSLLPTCLTMLVFVAAAAEAQTTPDAGAAPRRGWVDVNFLSLRSSQDAQGYAFVDSIFLEPRTFATGYPALPSGEGVGVDVGFLVASRFAVGVTYNGLNYEYQTALIIDAPHPVFRNRYANDVDATANRLTREDTSLDLSLIYVPRTPDAWRIRVFGGPTWFRVRQEMVSNIIYDQAFNLLGFNSVDIQRFESVGTEGTAWGLHAGVDVGYFFSRHVGVGGVVRVNRGSVTVDEPLSDEEANLTAGHMTVGGGLRLRF